MDPCTRYGILQAGRPHHHGTRPLVAQASRLQNDREIQESRFLQEAELSTAADFIEDAVDQLNRVSGELMVPRSQNSTPC